VKTREGGGGKIRPPGFAVGVRTYRRVTVLVTYEYSFRFPYFLPSTSTYELLFPKLNAAQSMALANENKVHQCDVFRWVSGFIQKPLVKQTYGVAEPQVITLQPSPLNDSEYHLCVADLGVELEYKTTASARLLPLYLP
jgi:hypothetical protein